MENVDQQTITSMVLHINLEVQYMFTMFYEHWLSSISILRVLAMIIPGHSLSLMPC